MCHVSVWRKEALTCVAVRVHVSGGSVVLYPRVQDESPLRRHLQEVPAGAHSFGDAVTPDTIRGGRLAWLRLGCENKPLVPDAPGALRGSAGGGLQGALRTAGQGCGVQALPVLTPVLSQTSCQGCDLLIPGVGWTGAPHKLDAQTLEDELGTAAPGSEFKALPPFLQL